MSSDDARQTKIILGLTLAVLVLPVVLDLLLSDQTRVFGYLAADFFYYLTVGQNIVELGEVTFDQQTPTNGFHPLWQLMCTGLVGLASRLSLSDVTLFQLVIVVNSLLLAAGVTWTAFAWRRAFARPSGWFVLTVPSVLALITAPVYQSRYDFAQFRGDGARPIVGTLWHYANGMETGLVIAAWALMLWWLIEHGTPRTDRAGALLGLLGGVLTLARLDHVFFAAAFIGHVGLQAIWHLDLKRIRAALVSGLVFAAVLLLYLLANKLTVDVWLPVSGSVKSTFPLVENGNIIFVRSLLNGPKPPFLHAFYREAQILLPLAAVLAYIPFVVKLELREQAIGVAFRDDAVLFDRLMVSQSVAVFILAAYNFFFVAPTAQGNWYFPISSLLLTIVVIRILERTLAQRVPTTREHLRIAVGLTVLSALFFVHAQRNVDYHRDVAEFYIDEAPLVRDFYAAKGKTPKVIEYYDALFAASTRLPTYSGFGLVVDRKGAKALRKNKLFKHAVEQGFDRVHSFYLDAGELPEAPVRGDLIRFLGRFIPPPQLDPYDLHLEYRSPSGRFAVVRVIKKPKPKNRKKTTRKKRRKRDKRKRRQTKTKAKTKAKTGRNDADRKTPSKK